MDIHEINLNYLQHLRDFSLRRGIPEGAARYGASLCFVEKLVELPLSKLQDLAEVDSFMFQCPLTATDIERMLQTDDRTRSAISVIAAAAGAHR